MSTTILGALDAFLDAISGLTGSIVNLTSVTNVSACGCPVGEAPDNDGTDGETIPDDVGSIHYSEPDPAPGYDRKCRVAEVIWNTADELLDKWDVWDVDQYAQVGLTGMASIIGATFGLLGGPIGVVIGAVGGAAIGIALQLIAISFNVDDMKDFLDAKKSEFICALYTSDSTSAAQIALEQLMNIYGLSTTEKVIFTYILSNAVLSTLFFDTDGMAAYLDGFTPTFDCDTCPEVDCLTWFIMSVADGGGGTIVAEEAGFLEVSSVVGSDGKQRIGVIVNWLEDNTTSCGAERQLDASVIGGTFTPFGALGCRAWRGDANPLTLDYQSSVLWSGFRCVRRCIFVSTTSFTLRLDAGADC